jgi:hypothetical protein
LALIFLRGMVNEIIPASSARFSCNDIRSRNRSPPVQLSCQDTREILALPTGFALTMGQRSPRLRRVISRAISRVAWRSAKA